MFFFSFILLMRFVGGSSGFGEGLLILWNLKNGSITKRLRGFVTRSSASKMRFLFCV